MTEHRKSVPLWLKLAATAYLCVFIPVYWSHWGAQNFLWFSDIALFVTVAALLLESRFLISMMAVNVLLADIFWNLDFFARLIFGSHLFGLGSTSYMFNPELGVLVKALSFSLHFFLPIILAWFLMRLGYHCKAWRAQALLAWLVLPLCYFFTDPTVNINWVFGLGDTPQEWMNPHLYLLLLMAFFPLAVYLPSHLLFSYLLREKG